MPDGVSNAICTTAPNSGWFRWGSSCALWRPVCRPTSCRSRSGFQISSRPSPGFRTDLQELSRGIHPAILSKGGLGPAIKVLARRSAVPVELVLGIDRRLPDPVEVAAYYVVAESLTNAAKHAQASTVDVGVNTEGHNLHLSIRDDGIGGADAAKGSGLTGLHDRVEALGGTLSISSQPGTGTALHATIPFETP